MLNKMPNQNLAETELNPTGSWGSKKGNKEMNFAQMNPLRKMEHNGPGAEDPAKHFVPSQASPWRL